MVRHTDADARTANDQTTTRRTRADLRYLAAGDFDDSRRNTRVVSHGWVGTNGRKTGDGEVLAATVEVLDRRGLFDETVDVMGMGDFVDTVTTVESPLSTLAGVRTIDAVATEAFAYGDDVSNYPDEYDPTPSLTFDTDTAEVAFDKKSHARLFADFADRFDPEHKHDERFKSNRNPRRFVVDVTA